MDADGTDQTNRSSNPASDRLPAWSPDGKKIAFTSFRNGDSDIFVMKANGDGQRNRTKNSLVVDYVPDWQPIVP